MYIYGIFLMMANNVSFSIFFTQGKNILLCRFTAFVILLYLGCFFGLLLIRLTTPCSTLLTGCRKRVDLDIGVFRADFKRQQRRNSCSQAVPGQHQSILGVHGQRFVHNTRFFQPLRDVVGSDGHALVGHRVRW